MPLQSKYDCWEAWLDRDAEGQPPHRILYARERMVALAYGEPLEVLLPPSSPVGSASSESATAQTRAVETGETPADDDAPESPRGFVPERPRYRGDPTCDPVCSPSWQQCMARCTDGRVACVEACESEYRACMRGCF